MENIILFDDAVTRKKLLPLTFTRPVSKMRVGILTIAEKWEHQCNTTVSFCTEEYLSTIFKVRAEQKNIYINGSVCPNKELIGLIGKLNSGEVLKIDETIVAFKSDKEIAWSDVTSHCERLTPVAATIDFTQIINPWDIFHNNGNEIRADYELLVTADSKQKVITDQSITIYNEDNVFISEDAKIKSCVLNAENGPIYIGPGAEVQEGSLIRGPFALCEGSIVNMGAKIKGDSTVGPYSKVGGEVSNSVIFGYSNKGHDGFIGNSVIGEWCNLGADTNTSNLKNNYAEVRLWNYDRGGFQKTGLQFCGLIMGDHSKCAINTMFNTGTVVGVNANVFGSGFPRNFIPSYSWGGSHGFETYQTKKAVDVAQVVMKRRKVELSAEDIDLMNEIFEQTREYRYWDKD